MKPGLLSRAARSKSSRGAVRGVADTVKPASLQELLLSREGSFLSFFRRVREARQPSEALERRLRLCPRPHSSQDSGTIPAISSLGIPPPCVASLQLAPSRPADNPPTRIAQSSFVLSMRRRNPPEPVPTGSRPCSQWKQAWFPPFRRKPP